MTPELHNIKTYMKSTQNNSSVCCEMLESNAEEADVCVWRHVRQISSMKVLVYSIDSDVHNIGIGLIDEIGKDMVI